MEHITYEDYVRFGGKVGADDFPCLLIDCEAYLEKITFNRIHTLDDNIKRLIVHCIDDVLQAEKDRKGITSYSDGIESISYESAQTSEIKIKNLCRQFLPSELLYRGRRWRA